MSYLLLLIGLAMVLLGAHALTDGAAAIATRFRIPQLVIGLTIVAFGTSAPELIVSTSSALRGSTDMAIANIVGSNLFNTLMLVGVTALFAPIVVQHRTLRLEIPLCILASVVLFVMADDKLMDGSLTNLVSRSDGFVLLAFFLIFLSYSYTIASGSRKGQLERLKYAEPDSKSLHTISTQTANSQESVLQESVSDDVIESIDVLPTPPMWRNILFFLVGLALLVLGGDIFVSSASDIAYAWGVSEAIIGLTLVAVGTSLPELATSIVAALKKNPELAIGNAIGSNLMNIFLILGLSSTLCPLELGNVRISDLALLVVASIILWIVALFFGQRTITRVEGIVLILLYVAYMLFRVFVN
ncbi:MAG: calcium/sodium antiporter [Bacteroidaceae bacterium]